MTRNPYGRKRLNVEHDSDGGLTIHDPHSDLVVSIISTHPAASGPHGLTVEVYDYRSGDVMWTDVTRREPGDDSPVALTIKRHPTMAFYPQNREGE